ncbi:MAG: hypothetical protein Q4F21_03860 [Lachnospiraceae bacterium]|nr:hypothetical protein [Lachnospiraceae bacterium]
MKKAGLNRLLLLCLCAGISIFLLACSAQTDSRKDVSGKGKQTDTEVSDTGSGELDEEKIKTDSDVSEDGSEAFSEGETLVTDILVYNYASMDNVLAAMVCAMGQEKVTRFYREDADEQLMREYVYSYVNLFDSDTFQKVEKKGKNHTQYFKMNQEYLDELLICAFGEKITSKNLTADKDMILKKGNTFYVAAGDVAQVTVDYTGIEKQQFDESEVYSFDYEKNWKNQSIEAGIVQAKFQESEKAEAGIILKAMAITIY